MKKFLLATAAFAFLATSAFAETNNFENNELYVKAIHKNLEFSLEGNQSEGFTKLEARALVLTYAINPKLNSGIEVFDAYTSHGDLDAYTVGGSYNMAYTLTPATTLYGETELAYTSVDATLGEHVTTLTPKVGVAAAFNDRVTGFAEVEYAFAVNKDWADMGGRAEVGLDIAVNDSVMVVPSVVGYFDSNDLNEVQGRVGVEFKF